jgi:tRNA 2-thiouridine synthesizing protein A
MGEFQIDKKLDCSGMLCPMPVVKTKKALKDMAIGGILEMLSTDAGAMPDMHAWAKQTGHELLDSKDEGNGKYVFVIKKTH